MLDDALQRNSGAKINTTGQRLFLWRSSCLIEELGGHFRYLLVHGFAIDAGVIHEKLGHLLFAGVGADVEKCVMADAAGQDGEFARL